jgi:hypothetical protein
MRGSGGWLELHNLYPSPYIIRVIKSRRMRQEDMWHRWNKGKAGRKRPLGRPRRRWEDIIRMELGEIRW